MKKVTISKDVWVSFDSVEHETEEACRKYEGEHSHMALVGLSEEEIVAALDRAHPKHRPEIAAALENAGTAIARARREAGDLKRTRNPSKRTPPAEDTRDMVAEAKDEMDSPDGGKTAHDTLLTDDGVNWKPASEFA